MNESLITFAWNKMRFSKRTLRHSSLSPFLVPLVLPLLLLVPGARNHSDEAPKAEEVQEVTLEEVDSSAPENSPAKLPGHQDADDGKADDESSAARKI